MTWGAIQLTVKYAPSKVALDSVDFEVSPQAVHAVVGGDGAGKTTLLRALAGIGVPHTGELRLPGSGRTGYVPPQGGVFGDLSVAENMEFAADAYRLKGWKPREQDLLERAGLAEFRDRLGAQLSGGQRRKLAGSMALLPRPDMLVLDEVTTGVDPVSRLALWRLIAAAAADGAAVVVATSYLDEAERAASVLVLHEGRVLGSGDPAAIIDEIPGSIASLPVPVDTSTAWRRGRTWRQWDPDGLQDGDGRPTLEDAVIVAELGSVGERS